ncbi:MAG TPA: hypothetical protein VGJ03_04440 [Acidimicrobiales bacterium]|jgi:hypothetical protein
MKKTLAAVAFGLGTLLAVASPAFANAGGIPNNCVGQTTSYTAQGNDISPFVSANGIGNVAKANGVSTKDAVNYIKVVVCGR